MTHRPAVLLACLLLMTSGTQAQDILQTRPGPAAASSTSEESGSRSLVPGVMPPAEAFAMTAFVEAEADVALLWEMPPAYYLYRKSLQVELPDGTILEDFTVPDGDIVEDEFFGESEVYFERLLLRLPLDQIPAQAFAPAADGGRQLDLMVTYQGCAEEKYCYPPQHVPVTLALP